MTNANALDLATTHRAALVEIGWECGPIVEFGDEIGFEVVRGAQGRATRGSFGVKAHRRTFAADGTMTVSRHGGR